MTDPTKAIKDALEEIAKRADEHAEDGDEIEREYAYGMRDALSRIAPVAGSLLSRLEEAEREAKRYRWLRDQHWVEPEARFRLNLSDSDDARGYERELDAAIDAAMKEQSK